MSSCINKIGDKGNLGKETNTQDSTVNSTDKIQLWVWSSNNRTYNNCLESFIENIKEFCKVKTIPLEVHAYTSDVINKDDYILKRNIAAASGNMIIIDDLDSLHTIAEQHADYSKLESYDKLIDANQNRFCIPLGIMYYAEFIDDEAMKYYGIDLSQKPVITYRDYLNIKQEMKEKGAKFKLNYRELNELIRYYLDKNNLLFVNEDSEIIQDEEKFKEMLKKAIIGLCYDIVTTNNGSLDEIDIIDQKTISYSELCKKEQIYDKKSQLTLNGEFNIVQALSFQDSLKAIGILYDKVFIINPLFLGNRLKIVDGSCFYMYKKITNDKIYDVANFIVSESSVQTILSNDPATIPQLITDNIKETLKVDENWKLKEEFRKINPPIKRIIDTTYELIFIDEIRSKEIADYNFSNGDYIAGFRQFVENTIFDIAKELSGKQLSLEKFDIKNDEINKLIDQKVEDFVKNFNVLNN
jgi:hypothetical protein